jgi:hypothetical protein
VILADPPRKYSRRGRRWSHLSSPVPGALESYARAQGLKRKHRTPWIHYDVTEEELQSLPDVRIVTRRELSSIMKSFRQPRKHAAHQG